MAQSVNPSRAALETSLLKSLGFTELGEILGNMSEVALDAVLEEGLFRDLPIVSTIISIGKTSVAIRERIFLKKILLFLGTAAEVTPKDREAFTSKLERDPAFQRRVGETLIVIIDRLDDLDKPAMLAKVFNGYIRGEIDFPMFLRLAASIDRAVAADLHGLLAYYSGDQQALFGGDELWERLYFAGLSNLEIQVYAEHQFVDVMRNRSSHPLHHSPSDLALTLAKLVLGDRMLRQFRRH